MFLQSIYHPTYTLRDTPFRTYTNFDTSVLKHVGADVGHIWRVAKCLCWMIY